MSKIFVSSSLLSSHLAPCSGRSIIRERVKRTHCWLCKWPLPTSPGLLQQFPVIPTPPFSSPIQRCPPPFSTFPLPEQTFPLRSSFKFHNTTGLAISQRESVREHAAQTKLSFCHMPSLSTSLSLTHSHKSHIHIPPLFLSDTIIHPKETNIFFVRSHLAAFFSPRLFSPPFVSLPHLLPPHFPPTAPTLPSYSSIFPPNPPNCPLHPHLSHLSPQQISFFRSLILFIFWAFWSPSMTHTPSLLPPPSQTLFILQVSAWNAVSIFSSSGTHSSWSPDGYESNRRLLPLR